MDNILLDTDILIDASRGRVEAFDFFKKLEGQVVFVSDLSYAELLMGAKSKQEQRWVDIFLQRFNRLAPDALVSERALDIIKRYSLAQGVGIIDAYIAATALEYDLFLFSRNKKHFKPIKGLHFEEPY